MRTRWFVPALVLMSGCVMLSDPSTPVTSAIEVVRLNTRDEIAEWPDGPEVSGGGALTVRGKMLAECGAEPRVSAERKGAQLSIVVRNVLVNRGAACWAVVSYSPYRVTIGSLEAGSYQVRVRVQVASGTTTSDHSAQLR